MKSLFIVTALLGWLLADVYAQDPHFTQAHSQPLILNPAYAGVTHNHRLVTGLRSQWPRRDGGGNYTAGVSFDSYIQPIKSGLGIIYKYDRWNRFFSSHSIDAVYSFHQKIGEFTLVPALQAGLFNRRLDQSETGAPQAVDPNVSAFTLSAGIIGYWKTLFIGFATHHLNEPNIAFTPNATVPLTRKYTLHGGYTQPIGESAAVSFWGYYINQRPFEVKALYMAGFYNGIKFGLGYRFNEDNLSILSRNENALLILLGYENELFTVGYSYDHSLSTLKDAELGGSHELQLNLLLSNGNDDTNDGALDVLVF